MLTTRHAVNFSYTRQEQEALFCLAREEDVDKGGHYDARRATITLWSHHWLSTAASDASEILGTFYVRWDEPQLWPIETETGFCLEDLLQALGRLESRKTTRFAGTTEGDHVTDGQISCRTTFHASALAHCLDDLDRGDAAHMAV